MQQQTKKNKQKSIKHKVEKNCEIWNKSKEIERNDNG